MRYLLAFLPIVVLAATPAHATPSYMGAWNGSTAMILSNSAASPKFRCAYSLTATFTDGTNQSTSGSTDVPVGITKGRVVQVEMNKTITNVLVTSWLCSTIP